MSVFIIILKAVYYLLELVNFLIVIRCIFSWIPTGLDNKFGNYLIMLTEPFMAPARKLFYKFEFARNLPVDLSPLLAFFLIYLVQRVVNALINIFYYGLL